jgi:hypothetical protein
LRNLNGVLDGLHHFQCFDRFVGTGFTNIILHSTFYITRMHSLSSSKKFVHDSFITLLEGGNYKLCKVCIVYLLDGFELSS